MNQIFTDAKTAAPWWQKHRPQGKIVFTNGCFDILHAGHVAYLQQARDLGDFLVLGLNSDASIRRLKGAKRPIVPFLERATVLAALRAIDLVVGFEEDTPLNLIKTIAPDILAKGGDWKPDQIVGGPWVIDQGGEVHSLKFIPGSSTTNIIETVLARHQG